jgi:hypothetical protein
MMREYREKWLELCEQAADEQDPKKLMELVKEIDRLLALKELRVTGATSRPAKQITESRGAAENSEDEG